MEKNNRNNRGRTALLEPKRNNDEIEEIFVDNLKMYWFDDFDVEAELKNKQQDKNFDMKNLLTQEEPPTIKLQNTGMHAKQQASKAKEIKSDFTDEQLANIESEAGDLETLQEQALPNRQSKVNTREKVGV